MSAFMWLNPLSLVGGRRRRIYRHICRYYRQSNRGEDQCVAAPAHLETFLVMKQLCDVTLGERFFFDGRTRKSDPAGSGTTRPRRGGAMKED